MGSDTVEIETTSVFELEELSDEIGEKYILGREDREDIMYLAALAIECYERNDYDLVDTLMEFLENNSTAQLNADEAEEVEQIIEEAYNRRSFV